MKNPQITITRTLLANAIRFLSIDAVEKANSGHPGAPMGMADIAEVLWNDFLKHNPANPNWWNRDRFILSNGHASMLLYSLLHLTGYDVSIEDLKNFRQLHSKTPGHPEYGHTPGVETTTGPLGQGFANAVGIALAEKLLANQFNRENFPIIDHYTYVFMGDGCMMEGISHEAASLAGRWELGKLIVFYDDNGISIDGKVYKWFIDDTKKRFEAYNWHVIPNIDGHNPEEIKKAIIEAQNETTKPSLIICKTQIGYGSPNKANTEAVHGAPLGEKEVQETRKNLNWHYPPFEIPVEIYQAFDAREKGAKLEHEWNLLFSKYKETYPDLAKELERRMNHHLPDNFDDIIKNIAKQEKPQKEATRKTSQNILNRLVPNLPELLGGSADLTHSNLTNWKQYKDIVGNHFDGDYIYYGVREFGMSAIMNGLFLHGGFRPFGGTFLIFSDYARNAIRLSALMNLGVIYILTHDSIAIGEDGPTHQPIEQIPSLRMIPNLQVFRPYNYLEVLIAWEYALKNTTNPTAILLTRQNVNMVYNEDLDSIRKGAYIIYGSTNADITILSSGSEVALAIDTAKFIEDATSYKVKVVSMLSMEVFRNQTEEYKLQILGNDKSKRFAIEASTPVSWYEWTNPENCFGIQTFGLSAPGDVLMKHFGFTPENLKNIILNKMKSL